VFTQVISVMAGVRRVLTARYAASDEIHQRRRKRRSAGRC
jgi:hypothetical protein